MREEYYAPAPNPMDRQSDFGPSTPVTVIGGATYGLENIERADIKDIDSINQTSFGDDFGFKVSDIGISTHPGKDQLEGLKARIFQGASQVELGFFGRGKGSMQGGNTTPEMFSGEERRDIRELARLNEIKLTSHAGLHDASMAGWVAQQGRFDESFREKNLFEIKRAIDFTADVSQGGAVVFHVHEYDRPVGEYYGKEGFKAFQKEDEKAQFHVVNERTGAVQTVRKDQYIYQPVFKTNTSGQWIDREGNPIDRDAEVKDLLKRVPVIDESTKQFKTEMLTWDYFDKRAKNWNEKNPKVHRTAEEYFVRLNLLNQAIQSRGSSSYYRRFADPDIDEQYDKLNKAYDYFKKIEKNVPVDEQWKILENSPVAGMPAKFVPYEQKLPSEVIKKQLENMEGNMRFIATSAPQADVQASQIEKEIELMKPMEDYAIQKTADTIARAGIYAMQKTEQMKKQPYNKNVEIKPLFAAVENAWMPDIYGAHPQELKKIILESRKEMRDQLVHQGYDEHDAQKRAEDHIKATIDTGHANTWKKYFQGDPKKTIEQNDNMFKKWLIGQMDDLIKHKLIGHIHVSDNFGYEDEHLTPGWGNAPINEFLQKVKKLNPTIIVEPAHQDYRTVLGGWKRFGQNVYGLPTRGNGTWADVEHSYFGRPASPYFLFGETAPNPEQWQLWSQVKLE